MSHLDKYLAIAKMLREVKGRPGVVKEITSTLKVSGKDVGIAKRLCLLGHIRFDSNGNPYFASPIEDVEAAIEEIKEVRREAGLDRDDLVEEASRAVDETLRARVAERAATMTEADLRFAEAVVPAVVEYLSKRGFSLQELRENPPHDLVLEALSKAEKYDELERRVKELEERVRYYESRYSPIEHARMIVSMLTEVALSIAMLRKVGVRIRRGGLLARYYNNVISRCIAYGGVGNG